MHVISSILSLFVPLASAAEPPDDVVLVAPFTVGPGGSAADAARLTEVAIGAAAGALEVITLDEVPAFPDYSAATWLTTCAPADRLGCVHVAADRAAAGWAIDGQVSGEAGEAVASITFLDVARARTVFALTVPVSDDDALGTALVSTLDVILAGEVDVEDLRGEIETARDSWEEGRQGAEDAAMELVGMEEELGAALEMGGRAVLVPNHLTADDLAEMVGEDDAIGPWDKLGMDQDTYLRFKNSGLSESAFRARQAGRAGALWLRAFGGAALSPTGVSYDATAVRDPVTLTAVQARALEQASTAVGPWGGIEVGIGVHRVLEVGVSARGRYGPVHFTSTVQYEGDIYAFPQDEEKVGVLSWDLGAFAVLAPAPEAPLRPTVLLGASYWMAPEVEQVIDVQTVAATLPALKRLTARAAPGVEGDVAPGVALFARAALEVPIGGARQESSVGDEASLPDLAEISAPPVGVGADVGVQVRFGLGR